jgi:hypothetical protein
VPIRILATAVLAGLLAACAPALPSPVPTPSHQAPLESCAKGDNPWVEQTLGWAFCYPGTWHFRERLQTTDAPSGLDATFDITDFVQGPDSGKFGFMIISTDNRGGAATLADWVGKNLGPTVQLQPISWANSVEAAQEVGGDRRFALTAHQVVVLELRSGAGNLDLEGAMSARLSTWKFLY